EFCVRAEGLRAQRTPLSAHRQVRVELDQDMISLVFAASGRTRVFPVALLVEGRIRVRGNALAGIVALGAITAGLDGASGSGDLGRPFAALHRVESGIIECPAFGHRRLRLQIVRWHAGWPLIFRYRWRWGLRGG